jgi:DNA-binding transcriptional LysR family regulator
VIAHKYLFLIALAREQHFARAAELCQVSTASFMAALRDIETELGVSIVKHGTQFAGLTAAGEHVLDCARQMTARTEALRSELARIQDGLAGRLRLGVIPTALTAVATFTAAFARRHPRVDVEIRSLGSGDIVAALRSGELDGGIVYLEAAAADFTLIPLWRENHVLLTPQGGPFEGHDCVTWFEAAQIPLCLMPPAMHNRQVIDAVFVSLGLKPRPTLETDSVLALLAHVSSGRWSSIVPRAVLDPIGVPGGTRIFEMRDPVVEWSAGLLTLNGDSRPAMVDALIEEARALGAEILLDPS